MFYNSEMTVISRKAKKFLQNMITNDVDKPAQHIMYSQLKNSNLRIKDEVFFVLRCVIIRWASNILSG